MLEERGGGKDGSREERGGGKERRREGGKDGERKKGKYERKGVGRAVNRTCPL